MLRLPSLARNFTHQKAEYENETCQVPDPPQPPARQNDKNFTALLSLAEFRAHTLCQLFRSNRNSLNIVLHPMDADPRRLGARKSSDKPAQRRTWPYSPFAPCKTPHSSYYITVHTLILAVVQLDRFLIGKLNFCVVNRIRVHQGTIGAMFSEAATY
ncbi:hypothetical protein GUITHDRAFT_151582 [Guillardia theta CCMP2712]|uniref:Uncharacterized protein n=1 Tax=Guillardia theta (strain CCMP2712) TaxID=905079 RepID=L1JLL3_GUITC|nr:hypothetical protein GUITHDRAFT_151582 [Guillardia theta CCMP2712]EKX49010.1 hypothetical protein GUITHDRAFT_151582 [Guillardia theta CCMP2712]|eukprot:XP_005835990.1 hypothetical protein GUITHDRAFT_151582 [Guillardia theta CCMP2712]